jgi:hypothetical protein
VVEKEQQILELVGRVEEVLTPLLYGEDARVVGLSHGEVGRSVLTVVYTLMRGQCANREERYDMALMLIEGITLLHKADKTIDYESAEA